MQRPLRSDGKTALVTGSSSGIGLAIVQAFAAAGAKVVVHSIDAPLCRQVAAELVAGGAEAVALPGDVMDGRNWTS